MDKNSPGKESQSPSRVNFSVRMYEEKDDPFSRDNSLRSCLL